MIASGIEPTVVGYTSVVSALAHCGEVERALELLREMKEDAGIEPNEQVGAPIPPRRPQVTPVFFLAEFEDTFDSSKEKGKSDLLESDGYKPAYVELPALPSFRGEECPATF